MTGARRRAALLWSTSAARDPLTLRSPSTMRTPTCVRNPKENRVAGMAWGLLLLIRRDGA